MFVHNKRLQYTVRVAGPNPGLANLLLEQFGGPQGELAAACRYFTQAIGEDDPGRKDMLLDIATEELSHLEIIGSIVAMLNKGAKGQLAEGVEAEAVLYRSLTGGGNDSHITAFDPAEFPAGQAARRTGVHERLFQHVSRRRRSRSMERRRRLEVRGGSPTGSRRWRRYGLSPGIRRRFRSAHSHGLTNGFCDDGRPRDGCRQWQFAEAEAVTLDSYTKTKTIGSRSSAARPIVHGTSLLRDGSS
jgi:hypothetical protein